MDIALIAAMTIDRVIGKDGSMPWHLPADLAHFKQITLGKPIIMGRKTFESIGRPLPGRDNIVITRQADWQANGCQVVHSLESALQTCQGADEVMIIGGGTIYQQALPMADRLYLTLIDASIVGDTHFPEWHPSEWQKIEETTHAADAHNAYACRFVTLACRQK